MNRHLEIMFDRVKNLEILSKLTKEEVLQIIRGIPFLKVIKKNSSKQEYVQIQYENARKLILVTGIHRPFIEEMVSKFNNHYRRQYDQGFGKSPSAKIINNNHYWINKMLLIVIVKIIIQMIIKIFFLRLLIFFIRENQSKNLVRFVHNNLFNAFIQP